jgi:hypothetical protein
LPSGSTIGSIAEYFGTTVAREPSDTSASDETPPTKPISRAEREYFGYGDVPDELIWSVLRKVEKIVEDPKRLELATGVAGMTMQIVQGLPDIDPGLLRQRLHDSNLVVPDELSGDELVALEGVVISTHGLAASYFQQPAPDEPVYETALILERSQ